MPLLILILARAFELVGMWVAEVLRRVRGTYRTGYALVTDDASMGDTWEPDGPFQMASSPLFRPPGAGALPVAILRDAIRRDWRQHRSACVQAERRRHGEEPQSIAHHERGRPAG
jgi:hypothetical protein